MKNNQRRKFLKASLVAATGLGIGGVTSSCAKETGDLSNMFVHHVFFWMKKPENRAAFEKLKKGLEKLVTIETIRFKQVGVPANTDREVIDNTYQFSLLVIFDNEKGHDIYQEHKIHKDFIAECSELWERVLVYDSWKC